MLVHMLGCPGCIEMHRRLLHYLTNHSLWHSCLPLLLQATHRGSHGCCELQLLIFF